MNPCVRPMLGPLAEQRGMRRTAERRAPAVTHQPRADVIVDRDEVPRGGRTGDDFPDLVTANFESDNVSVLLNAADWPVAPRGALRIPAASSQAAADRSREGDSDRTAVDFQFAGAASWQLSPVDRCLPEVDSAVPLAIVVKKVREPDWPDWAQLP